MFLGFNGATTMKATLAEDIAAASVVGFKALEIWAAKMDTYLVSRSLDDLNALFTQHRVHPVSINSIEFITFRSADDYALIKARCHELCARADALGCDKIVVVPSPTPGRRFLGGDQGRVGASVARFGRHRYSLRSEASLRVPGLWLVLGAHFGPMLRVSHSNFNLGRYSCRRPPNAVCRPRLIFE